MPIYVVARLSARRGPGNDSDHAAQGKRKRRTYRKRSVPARRSFVKMRIHVLRNLPGGPFGLSPIAGQCQKESRRLPLFRDLGRGFQFRDQMVADRNVKDLVRMLSEPMDQTRQETPGFGDAQMSGHGMAPFRHYNLADPPTSPWRVVQSVQDGLRAGKRKVGVIK